jgi:NTE family protein
MTPQHVISQLLESDSKNLKNYLLLKKIILASYFGRLQINGQSPDNSITFANYLFDHERTMFDFTRLSDAKKILFQKWLLGDHQKEKEKSHFSNYAANEYRGFTAEVRLSWWSRFTRWMRRDHGQRWKIKDIDLTLNYQLLGVEMCTGQQGILVGFDQLLVPPTGSKYKAKDDNQTEPLGNTKRVFITDNLVDQLSKINLSTIKFETICKSSHPLSISVTDVDARHKEMLEHRKMQKYIVDKPWYARLWEWIKSWFMPVPVPVKIKPKKISTQLTQLYENDSISIYQRSNQQILVKEKRPNIENLVYCGGGAKIFAHIGVWKALKELNIAPKKFAGSSAGAIMALMCYLGYSAQEIADLFKYIRKEHLVYIDLNSKGFSDPQALKTALDYAIAQKVQQIVTQYNIPYPQGPITFTTLEALKVRCPGCGLGDELIVTATNKRLGQTKYFSLHKTPNIEVSQAVQASASIPVVFRVTRIEGDDYNDGGVLNNFPTDAFHADDTTFLESEYGNNMKTLAVQFDNGTERATVDGMARVYRENFFLNWIYGFLTGVSDPASGWEQDRLKLRKYSAQSIIVDAGSASTTGFSVEEDNQVALIKNGYQAARSYLSARFACKTGSSYKNKEVMHSKFDSLEELLAYCCYKGDKDRFYIVFDLIKKSSLLNKEAVIRQALKLKSLYFNSTTQDEQHTETHTHTFFGNEVKLPFFNENKSKEHITLVALYPIFLKLTNRFISNVKEHDLLERARHAFTAKTPFNCLGYFDLIKGETHIVFHIFHNLIKDLRALYLAAQATEEQYKKVYEQLQLLQEVMYTSKDLFRTEYYAQWDLNTRQGERVLNAMKNKDPGLMKLCESLKRRSEPLEDFSGSSLEDIEDYEAELYSVSAHNFSAA